MDGPENIGTLGLFVLVVEVLASTLLLYWKWLDRHRIAQVHGYSFVSASVLVASLAFSSSVYAAGMTGELILPNRTLVHGHGEENASHDDSDNHHEDMTKTHEKVGHLEEDIEKVINNNEEDDIYPHVDDDRHL